ncbi:hypothetical protein [Kitasatospora sp. NPDC057541]|uniref:hypothetical protein n=1 Tax=Kitasatospora sp. NPDC057541 TaxID=3346161 RepID=UPI00368F9FD0
MSRTARFAGMAALLAGCAVGALGTGAVSTAVLGDGIGRYRPRATVAPAAAPGAPSAVPSVPAAQEPTSTGIGWD